MEGRTLFLKFHTGPSGHGMPPAAGEALALKLAGARGACVLRDYRFDQPRGGTVFVRGTMPIRNLVNLLPALEARGINVKVVAARSPQLFARQRFAYRDSVARPADRLDAMVITNGVQADAAMGGRAAGQGVLVDRGLGRPVAQRRLSSRGHRGSAPG